jgi:hypothetical protein
MKLIEVYQCLERGQKVRRDAWIPNCWIQKVQGYNNIEILIADENEKVFSRASWSPKIEDLNANDYQVIKENENIQLDPAGKIENEIIGRVEFLTELENNSINPDLNSARAEELNDLLDWVKYIM